MDAPQTDAVSQPARAAPVVIRVPPPERRRISRIVVLVAITLLVIVGLLLGESGTWGFTSLLATLALLLLPFVILLLRSLQIRRRAERIRRRVVAEAPDWEEDPVAARVARGWRWPTLPPDALEVQEAVDEESTVVRRAAIVVCLGVVGVPHVRDWRFEPEVIAPAHRWREFIPATGMAVFIAFCAFCCLGMPLTELWSESAANAFFLVLLAVLIGLSWIGPLLLWPRYTRLAPGVVQVLHYRPGKSKPRIVSYRMVPGTTAVVTNEIGFLGTRLSLSLVRSKQLIQLPLWRLRNRARFVERIWQALLSTAPTPPLSDEELVG